MAPLKHFIIVCSILFISSCATGYQGFDSRDLSQATGDSPNNRKDDISNNIEDGRIELAQPYKYLIQSTTKYALASSKLAKHVNIDTAMAIINDVFYMLSKPSTLAHAFKFIGVILSTFLTSAIFFPTTQKIADRIWSDPVDILDMDRFLSDGVDENSILDKISSRADEVSDKVGMNDSRCRERSLCYMGEILRCAFPKTSDAVARFASENFSSSAYRDNRYFKAFSFGFSDRNCTRVQTDLPESGNCLGRFINNILGSGKEYGSPTQ